MQLSAYIIEDRIEKICIEYMLRYLFQASKLISFSCLSHINNMIWQQNSLNLFLPQITFPCSGCGSTCGVLTALSGTISDGSGALAYGASADCRWLVAPSGMRIVTVTFTAFATQLNYDWVTLSSCTDVACGNRQQMLLHSGLSLPSPVSWVSTTGFVLIEFRSNANTNYQGFEASWSSATTVCLPIRNVCISKQLGCLQLS